MHRRSIAQQADGRRGVASMWGVGTAPSALTLARSRLMILPRTNHPEHPVRRSTLSQLAAAVDVIEAGDELVTNGHTPRRSRPMVPPRPHPTQRTWVGVGRRFRFCLGVGGGAVGVNVGMDGQRRRCSVTMSMSYRRGWTESASDSLDFCPARPRASGLARFGSRELSVHCGKLVIRAAFVDEVTEQRVDCPKIRAANEGHCLALLGDESRPNQPIQMMGEGGSRDV
jgi:hypothetical protein